MSRTTVVSETVLQRFSPLVKVAGKQRHLQVYLWVPVRSKAVREGAVDGEVLVSDCEGTASTVTASTSTGFTLP